MGGYLGLEQIMAKDSEQSKDRSSNGGGGGILGLAMGKHNIKCCFEQKTIEQKYKIMEVEKGHKSKSDIAKLFNVPNVSQVKCL